MSLKYKVVVIDDKNLFYKEYKETIDAHLEQSGFEADVDYIASEKDFNAYKSFADPDLYMVDLKFGQEDKGQIFIGAIREKFLTDILFYSSDHDAIQQYRQDVNLQGIYFAERDEQNDEVEPLLKKLLDKMIIKANAPRSTRGLVMECVAELDDLIKKKICTLEKQISDTDLTSIQHKIIKVFKDSADGRNKQLNDFFDANIMPDKYKFEDISEGLKSYNIGQLIENIALTDSNKNLKVLLILYKKLHGKDALYAELAQYESLLNKRNILAHVSQSLHERGYIFKSHNGKQGDYILDLEESILLRKTILNLYKIVERVEAGVA